MGNIQLGPVGSYITVNPTYESEFIDILSNRQDLRTRAGNLYSYIEGASYRQITLPLQWIDATNRSLINSWWKSGSNLRFIENSDAPSSYHTVRITNEEEPLTSYVAPYFQQYWQGELVMETV